MTKNSSNRDETKTRDAILKVLKTDGPTDSATLAERLDLTAMAIRQHLYALQEEKYVIAEERSGSVGRPTKFWKLTRKADRFFPDAYAELSVALIDAMDDAFGSNGLKKVLESRCSRQQQYYASRIKSDASLPEKLRELVKIRTEEGYMAELLAVDQSNYLIVENHCPICVAAATCKGFCETELELFQHVLGPEVKINREEHIVSGDRRCAYRVTSSADAPRKTGRK